MNYIFFDTETNSGRLTADILDLSAFFCDKDFNVIEEFNIKARLRKSRIYEIDSFLVNNLDPFDVDKYENSNFDLTLTTELSANLLLDHFDIFLCNTVFQ